MSSRATGMTTYLENGGTLEHAQQPFAEGFGLQAACPPKASSRRRIAAHESPRTTRPSVLGGEWSVLSGRRLLCANH